MPDPAIHVFTYGSLMFPEVWTRVVGGDYRSSPAIVHGYARYAVENETYPGMIPMPGASVPGLVYFNIASDDLAALDAFEGSDYRRESVTAKLHTGESLIAASYIFLPTPCLTGMPWDPQAFQLQRFLQTYCRARLEE